jgi:hypothetical protein
MNDFDISRLDRDVSELRQTVFGNGQNNPGIRSRVERIETKMETGVKILWGLLILAIPSAISLVAIGVSLMTYIFPR